MDEMKRIREVSEFLRKALLSDASVAVILGSGLGGFADGLSDRRTVRFADIPHFPAPRVAGHVGSIVAGTFHGVSVMAIQGRFHLYEGYPLSDVVLLVRALHLLGVRTLILTNACGAVNPAFEPGDLMVLSDHLNLTGQNPLIGKNLDELGTRFPDASMVYDEALRALAKRIAVQEGITLREGVYAWWSGPSYETPAEIRMIRTLGADAVGMSTVPEALAASHMKMKVIGIACLTNMATGIRPGALTHDEVLDVAAKAGTRLSVLLSGILTKMTQ
ncbi:MAG TPA: purine-nucleoside phosphorylase [Acholeplasmatales bacterium]|nr:MAG: purine-nucleoside phosphorylase [Tenericutes bacterium GWF2_57_13]HAQ55889.1 purine-nucleoside phosphorylase [Acholeplasmatales bacterium]